MTEGSNYINGEWMSSSKEEHFFSNINPCTEEYLGHFPETLFEEVDNTCEIAKEAFKKWRNISRFKRAEYLLKVATLIEKNKNRLARAISSETGKNYNESVAEVNEALHMAQYAFSLGRMPYGEAVASEISKKDSYMLRKPKGLVAIISPSVIFPPNFYIFL